MRALLDVNVLLALLDQDHVDHARARAWIETEITHGWASCAITENGFVRIISQPRYSNPISVRAAIELLDTASSTPHHEFWTCATSVRDGSVIDRSRVHGTREVTDVYLLGLAVSHGGRLVTLDRSISRTAVPAAEIDQLIMI